ncbi:MAG TPA: Nramp family divalent metal transporter [Syntrophomonadaceae bacterium]|nr:Nramp family divalent metal transporter [Syntrophomonadaceae bacterium]
MFNKIKTKIWAPFLIFLAVAGPGIITGSVDNDAGGITTYSVAGAQYGYNLLWTLIPAFFVLVVIQEMNARMGMKTGKGLADLIRESFGIKIMVFIFICLFIADIGNTTAEFAGVAGSMQVFNLSKYIMVPISGLIVWLLVVKGDYGIAEKVFLLLSGFLLMYVVSALMAHPDWHEIGKALVHPKIYGGENYLGLVIGVIGTTIAPWMQFYMQSAVMEKGLSVEEYKYEKWDVVLGAIATVVVAFFIMVACAATLNKAGITINEAKDAAAALRPLAGPMASVIFALGLFVASVFSATILPLATAFYICEAFGFEAGINKTWNEAPVFYWLFTAIILIAMAIILIPGAPLIKLTIWTQILNGMLLPVVLICMIRMVNNPDIMGEYTNTLFSNLVGWATIIVLIGLTGYLVLSPLIKGLFA